MKMVQILASPCMQAQQFRKLHLSLQVQLVQGEILLVTALRRALLAIQGSMKENSTT